MTKTHAQAPYSKHYTYCGRDLRSSYSRSGSVSFRPVELHLEGFAPSCSKCQDAILSKGAKG